MPLQQDSRGPFLALSPVEAPEVLQRLVAAGVPFTEDDGSGAGCVGPEAVVVRFPREALTPELAQRVAAALRGA